MEAASQHNQKLFISDLRGLDWSAFLECIILLWMHPAESPQMDPGIYLECSFPRQKTTKGCHCGSRASRSGQCTILVGTFLADCLRIVFPSLTFPPLVQTQFNSCGAVVWLKGLNRSIFGFALMHCQTKLLWSLGTGSKPDLDPERAHMTNRTTTQSNQAS